MSMLQRSGLGPGAGYGILALGVEKLVALGIALYLPRRLGIDDYGSYVFLLAYLALFQGLADASLDAVMVTWLARAEGNAARLAGRGAAARVVVSLAGGALGLVVLAVVRPDRELLGAGAIATVGLVAAAANPYRALLRSRLRMRRYVALLGGQSAIALGLLSLVLTAGGGIRSVLAAVSAANAAGLLLGRVLAGSGARITFDRGVARTLIVDAWPLAGTALALLAGQQSIQVLLLRQYGAAEVGLLGGAQKLTEAVALLPQAVMLTLLPALSAAASSAAAMRSARGTARFLVLVLLPVVVALVGAAEPVLVYGLGAPFAPAAPILRILAPAVLLQATGVVLTNLLLATGLQRVLLRVNAASAVLMVLVGVALVPAYGATGAAAAWATAMLAGQVMLLGLPVTRPLVRPVAKAVILPLSFGMLAALLSSLADGPWRP